MLKKILILLILVLIIWYGITKFTVRPSIKENSLGFIELPQGFHIEIFADNLGGSLVSTPGPNPGPRMMVMKDDTVLVTVPSQGKVFALEDKNKDSKVENTKVFIENLNNPHGIDFYEDWIYIAEEDKVIRVKSENNLAKLETLQELVKLPAGSHWTRTIKVFNDSMFISIGSSCNVCTEGDKLRATIQKCSLDGTNCTTFASGLRNSVGFIKYKNKIYATENGRDGLGNNIPPDEINTIKEGKDYGWPYCYGKQVHDKEFDKNTYIRDSCLDTEHSFIDLEAHSAPLGLAIYTGNGFPKEYKENMFVAYHGSWNKDVPTGYKIVNINLETKEVKDFATGWLSLLTVKGRPVDIINFRDSLLVSDDNAGKIYRIYHKG
ncbi:PQQ-dependent sugar dehydrogenase [Candidatus Woesearchaeota archaeon]|nr:PQQ-dependent sugar dehydrogenase [Candidatus Woesearchaeota archaeon]